MWLLSTPCSLLQELLEKLLPISFFLGNTPSPWLTRGSSASRHCPRAATGAVGSCGSLVTAVHCAWALCVCDHKVPAAPADSPHTLCAQTTRAQVCTHSQHSLASCAGRLQTSTES